MIRKEIPQKNTKKKIFHQSAITIERYGAVRED